MKQLILVFLISMMSFFGFSQDYPRIEIDSTGKKLVVMTYEQAQKIDNAFELLSLLEKARIECDNLTLSYVKVIDELKNQVSLLEIDVNLYKGKVIDKDRQIENLQERLNNCEIIKSTCDQQIEIRENQIVLLNEEITTLKVKKNIGWGVGIGGVILGVIILIVGN